jgi:hypothetical protein
MKLHTSLGLLLCLSLLAGCALQPTPTTETPPMEPTRAEPSAREVVPRPDPVSPERVMASDLFRAERQEAQACAAIVSDGERLTASDLFRAERQETCERRRILGGETLTGAALIRAAHLDAHEKALAWGMEDVAARELKMAQAVDLASNCLK